MGEGEIISYFQPTYYFIENPQTGKMKHYIPYTPYYDVDYCKYSNWGYRKMTRIWTNVVGFVPKLCKKDCINMDGRTHTLNIGHQDFVRVGDNVISLSTKELRAQYKDYDRILEKKTPITKRQRYRIPPTLIAELFGCIDSQQRQQCDDSQVDDTSSDNMTNKLFQI